MVSFPIAIVSDILLSTFFYDHTKVARFQTQYYGRFDIFTQINLVKFKVFKKVYQLLFDVEKLALYFFHKIKVDEDKEIPEIYQFECAYSKIKFSGLNFLRSLPIDTRTHKSQGYEC